MKNYERPATELFRELLDSKNALESYINAMYLANAEELDPLEAAYADANRDWEIAVADEAESKDRDFPHKRDELGEDK